MASMATSFLWPAVLPSRRYSWLFIWQDTPKRYNKVKNTGVKNVGNLKIEYININKLIPYINNPRINDGAVDKVASSIKNFGFKNPIIIDKDNEIIAGHTRLKAARKLNLDEVPTIRVEDLTEQQVKAFRIADNKVTEYSSWEEDLLMQELKDIEDIDMSEFGFSDEFFEPEVFEDDFDEEEEMIEEPITEPEDIYQLGNHRLMCGDATISTDVKKLVNGQKIDLYLTDPPYNVNYTGGTEEALTIQNDNMEDIAFRNFLIKAFKVANDVLKPGGAFYIWHADSEGYNFRSAAHEVGWQIRQCLIWVKNSLVLGRQDYQWQHEPCLYGWKDGAAHYFTADRTQTTVIEDRPNLKKMTKEELKDLVVELMKSPIPTTVLREDKPSRNSDHPTMKPIRLIGRLIANSTRKGETVLDTFGGSGSTLVAAEQLGRICYMMELDPKYCDVIINRWEQYTGQKAVLISE